MSSNGTTPHTTVTEVIRCRVCDHLTALPTHRPRVWTFRCGGCGNTLEIDLS